MKTGWLLVVAVGLGCGPAALAADWPQWRGPRRDGVSQETGLLKEWPKDGPKLLWQVKDVGDGFSTPAVVGDRIYLLSNKGADDEFVQALDAGNGGQLWSARLGKSGPNRGPQYPGARSTPTVDGELLYALGSDGDLICLETAKGAERWRKNLRTDFGGVAGNWAYAESPLIDGDVLVCTPGGKEATMVGLDKKTGDAVWKFASPEGDEAAYSSAIVVEAGGVRQYVQFLQKGLVGLDAKTHRQLWRYGRTADGSPANIPTPVAHDGLVYSAAGKTGGALVRLKVDKGEFKAEQVYFDAALPSAIGGSVQVGEYLYGANQTRGLLCIEFATGAEKWQEKGLGAGSVLYADGRLYVHEESGPVVLVEAAPDGYHEKGRFTPPDPQAPPDHRKTGKAWTYPVVANGRLYVRDLGVLWCYDVKDQKPSK